MASSAVITTIRGAILLLALIVFLGNIMMWIIMPTDTYYNDWLLHILTATNSTFFGIQGPIMLDFTLPILFIAVLGCIYMHLVKRNTSIIQSKENSNNFGLNSLRARAPKTSLGPGKGQRAVKIIHAGGHAEYYYMAIPAARIIEKYPSLILARPEVFHRPWDAIIRPEEILFPGQKYYVVPRQTVRKLRHRIRTEAKPFIGNISQHMDRLSLSSNTSSILVKPGLRSKARDRNRHVRFFGMDTTNQKSESDSVYVPSNKEEETLKKRLRNHKRRARNENVSESSLNAIDENINEC